MSATFGPSFKEMKVGMEAYHAQLMRAYQEQGQLGPDGTGCTAGPSTGVEEVESDAACLTPRDP